MISERIPYFKVLGSKVHLTEMSEVLEVIDEWIEDRSQCRYIVVTGMHGAMEARKRHDFKEIIDASSLFVPDGYSLVAVAKIRGFEINKRVCGTDLLWETCRHAELKGHSLFFYGDTDETLDALTTKLSVNFPNLKIAGAHSPPFRVLTSIEDAEEVEMINSSGADILWVGLGLPKQERWIFEHRHSLDVPVAIGVGAAFKFVSGKIKRAPNWIGDNGFEWLWRLIFEPRRVWKRVLLDGPHFVLCIIKESIDSNGFRKTK